MKTDLRSMSSWFWARSLGNCCSIPLVKCLFTELFECLIHWMKVVFLFSKYSSDIIVNSNLQHSTDDIEVYHKTLEQVFNMQTWTPYLLRLHDVGIVELTYDALTLLHRWRAWRPALTTEDLQRKQRCDGAPTFFYRMDCSLWLLFRTKASKMKCIWSYGESIHGCFFWECLEHNAESLPDDASLQMLFI